MPTSSAVTESHHRLSRSARWSPPGEPPRAGVHGALQRPICAPARRSWSTQVNLFEAGGGRTVSSYRRVVAGPPGETSPSPVYGAALLMRLGFYSPSRVRIPESPRITPVCMLVEHHAPVAQWIEHLTTDQKVRGSSPFGRTNLSRENASPAIDGGAFFMHPWVHPRLLKLVDRYAELPDTTSGDRWLTAIPSSRPAARRGLGPNARSRPAGRRD